MSAIWHRCLGGVDQQPEYTLFPGLEPERHVVWSMVHRRQRQQQCRGGVVDNNDGGRQQRQHATPTAWARTSRCADHAHTAAVKCIGGEMAGAIVQDNASGGARPREQRHLCQFDPPCVRLSIVVGPKV